MIGTGIDTFKGISPAEFFYRNRQMAGFGNPTQALYTTVRELIENSLDSCEEAGILPKIAVAISKESVNEYSVTVSDNGFGVPYEEVPQAFARVLYGSKYSEKQRRGTFGLGVTMSVLYGQITTDRPTLIHTRTTDGMGKLFKIYVDVEKNTPIVESSISSKRQQQGTTVSVTLNADFKRAKDRIIEYLRLTGISTPHARISFCFDDECATFGGYTPLIPIPPIVVPPHPRAADLELLRRLVADNQEMRLKDFLVHSFQQVGQKTAERFLNFINLDKSVIVGMLDRNTLSYLSASLRQYDEFAKPTADCLSPIGSDSFLHAVKAEFKSTTASYSQRGPLEWEGNPYIIEGVLTIGDAFEKADTPSLYRFANRVPLLYDTSDDVFSKMLKRIPWTRYGIQQNNRVAIFMHFCSTRVPYSAAGKQSISSVGNIEAEILALYRDLGRSLNRISERSRRKSQYQRKYREFSKIFNMLVKFSCEVAGKEGSPKTEGMVKNLFEVNEDV